MYLNVLISNRLGKSIRMTHVRKKVDALGKYAARRPAIELGFDNIDGRAANMPELRVTIRNEC
jgi:hypothetical protein